MRKTILLLPGFMCTADLWRDQLSVLADIGDCHVADMTQASTLQALAALALDGLPDRFCVAGFSLGGYLAQEILRQAAARIDRLALIDTSMHADTSGKRAERDALSRAARAPGAFTGISDAMLKSYVHPTRLADQDLKARIKAMTKSLGRETFLRQNAMVRPDGHDILARVSCPTAIVCGAQDRITPPPVHEEMRALIPQSTLTVIENCGHMAPMERPDAVTAVLWNLFAG